MKKVLSIILLQIVVVFCIAQNKQRSPDIESTIRYLGLTDEFVKEWQMDSLGCSKKRIKLSDEILDNKKLSGLGYADFIKIFGKPNDKINDSTFQYNIHATCKAPGKASLELENFSVIIFYFQNNKLVSWQDMIS